MKTVKVIFFKGKGLLSRLIRWQTRGSYSHVGILFESGDFYEAWTGSGKHLWRNGGVAVLHNYQVPADAIVVRLDQLPELSATCMENFARQQVGKRYDYRSVIRFLTRLKPATNDKFFCSELVMSIVSAGGCKLLHAPAAVVSPAVLYWSPVLDI